jgi:hypothetical protein
MNEADRKAYNENKLKDLYPFFRTKIEAVIREMELAGFRPRVQSGWRSPAEQLDAYRRGTSKLQYGFHNVTGTNGEKEALAADIWDDDLLSKVKVDYMLRLAAAAEAQGLITGIRWDLKDEESVLIDIALENKHWDAKVRVGWDPLHVEVTGMTTQEAREGRRPDRPWNPLPAESEPQSIPKRKFRVQNLNTNDVIEYDNWSTAFKPVTLLPVPYVSQLGAGAEAHKNDCGAACAVMLLRAYTSVVMTPDEFYTSFNLQGDPYLSVQTIRNAVGNLGVLTTFKAGLTMADLFNTFATGKPVIVLIRYKTLEDAGLTEKHYEGPHFAVGVGMDSKYIYVHDPLYTNVVDGEAHPYPLDMFWKSWKEVAIDPKYPNPERSAIIPLVGVGYRMQKPVVINTPSLNVRNGPSLGNAIVGSVKKGQVVKVRREINGWGEIATDQWIYLSYTLPAV